MQREVVAVSTERRNDEMHPVLHESGDEVHVARQAVEPRDDQRAAREPRLLQGCRKPRAQQQRILSGAGLNILIPGFDREPFARTERFNVMALRRKP